MFKLASMFVDIKADATPFNKAIDSIHGRLSTASVAVGTFTGNIAATIARSAVSMGSGLFDNTISAASTLNETVSKVGTVFEDSAGTVTAQADMMAQKFGLSKQAQLDAAATLGLFAQGAGQSNAKAAEFSNTMVKLASDAMSFYNVPFDVALQKIQSGLSGESEPLRAFGVFLNEDAVAAEALALGLTKSGEKLDDGAKVMARASLIQKGLAKANGDLERTYSGTENQSRKFWGTLENLGATIGTAVLPAFTKLLEVGNAGLASLMEGWESSKATVEGWSNSIITAIDTVGVVWRNLGDVWQIGRIKIAEAVANTIAEIEVMPGNIGKIAAWIGKNWYSLIYDGITLATNGFIQFFRNLSNASSAFGKWLADPSAGFDFKWEGLADGWAATADALPEMTKPALVDYQKQVDEVGERIAANEKRRAERMAADKKEANKPALAAAAATPAAAAEKKEKEKKAKEKKQEEQWSSRTFDAASFHEDMRAKQYEAMAKGSALANAANASRPAAAEQQAANGETTQSEMLKELRILNQTMSQLFNVAKDRRPSPALLG